MLFVFLQTAHALSETNQIKHHLGKGNTIMVSTILRLRFCSQLCASFRYVILPDLNCAHCQNYTINRDLVIEEKKSLNHFKPFNM